MTTNLTKDYFYQLVREKQCAGLEKVDCKMLIPGQAYLFINLNIEYEYRRVYHVYNYLAGYYQPGPMYDSYKEKINPSNLPSYVYIIRNGENISKLIRLTDIFSDAVNICLRARNNYEYPNKLVKYDIRYDDIDYKPTAIVDTYTPFPEIAMSIFKLTDIPRLKQELPALFLQEYQVKLAEPSSDTTKWFGKDFRKAKERFEKNTQQFL